MPVALLPPTTSSGGNWTGQRPLLEAPRYVRGRGNSRWHRVRSATVYPPAHGYDQRTIYAYWCGPHGVHGGKWGPLWLTDNLPDNEPACGTCVGRALGAGQDAPPAGMPLLRFDPRWQTPPNLCPGSGSDTLLTELAGGRCATCMACGDVHRTRATGGAHNPRWGLANHPPGPGLCQPCPFHAWVRIVARHGRAACGCGWPPDRHDN